MDKTEWWWTGRNNCTDRHYWPPRGVGFVCGLWYRLGWGFGKISPNPR